MANRLAGARAVTNKERTELKAFVAVIVAALLASPAGQSNDALAELRQACDDLAEDAVFKFGAGTIGTDMLACFDVAYSAGADVYALGRVRGEAEALAPATFHGVVVQQAAVRMCLVEEVRAVASMTIASRTEAQSLLERITAAFETAEESASDMGDPDSYRALVSLQAAFVQDLSARSSALPEIVRYEFAAPMPSLWIANRLYGDAARADGIERENAPRHPAFMPATGVALTA